MKAGLARHFDGWQLGAVMVFIVACISSVMVPRSANPEGLPVPTIDATALAEARKRSALSASNAGSSELPRSARLLGARLRALGRAEWTSDDAMEQARDDAAEAVRQALFESPEAVRAMGDYQAERFRNAYLLFLRRGQQSADLIELGGSMLREFAENHWLTTLEDLAEDSDVLLEGLFKRRFGRIVNDKDPQFGPDSVQEFVILRFTLLHPPRIRVEEGNTGGDGTGPFLLRRIDDIAARQPSYPTAFAKGIVLFRMGHFEASAASFDAFIQQGDTGPYRLRAINYLKSAVEHTEGL